jgi:hypothetical protein
MFKENSIILFKEIIIDSIYMMTFKYSNSIRVEQISTIGISQTVGCKLYIEENSFYFIFGNISTELMALSQDLFNISSTNTLTVYIDMNANVLCFLINRILVQAAINNIPHTRRQIRLIGRRYQKISVYQTCILTEFPVDLDGVKAGVIF